MTLGEIQILGTRYQFTAEDFLWSCRMCVGEGETTLQGARIVLACMVRRMAVIGMLSAGREPKTPWSWPTFTELLIGTENGDRGYSQPISHYWRDRGPVSRIERRARIRGLSLDDIPPNVKRAVRGILGGGRLPGPPAVHFADRAVSNASLTREPTWREERANGAKNVMISVPASRNYHNQHGAVRVKGRCIFS